MLIDITLKITPEMRATARDHTDPSLVGHMGTHFDVMHREFPLVYTERKAIVFDVTHITGRDIAAEDVDLTRVEKEMFVAFYTGYIDKVAYGTKTYFAEHPQLSDELIHRLVQMGISIIGVDCAGIRRTPQHIPADRYCAEHDVFVVENLCNLKAVLATGDLFTACTYPMNYSGMTGLPCRVIAKV